ncbi:hypothetical protein SLS58_005937 [Diplodia intermedia]|uniref:Uncharacterized protein n=1 Tax=Diplodia intermedia TaxID=856260 RepID=A0ABR3TPG7_9PEZI
MKTENADVPAQGSAARKRKRSKRGGAKPYLFRYQRLANKQAMRFGTAAADAEDEAEWEAEWKKYRHKRRKTTKPERRSLGPRAPLPSVAVLLRQITPR